MSKALLCFVAAIVCAGFFLFAHLSRAADGSGTKSVSPTSLNSGSSGNVLTFTFTATEAMNSGEIAITVPTGWSAPQGTGGTEGYTTVTSSLGTIATILDNADVTSGWSAGTACLGALALDTSVKQEGVGSVSCINGNENTGDRWYKNIAVQNWSGYTKAAFWIRSSLGIANGNRLQFAYDNDANIATPIELINLSQPILANTWTYVVVSFGATTRTSVTSFGFVIQNAELDSNTVHIDDLLIGPGLPTFPGGGGIRTRLLQLASGQTTTLTYGAGGGASGATAPASGEVSTFITRTRVSDAGTLVAISASPTVTVNDPAPTTTGIAPSIKAAFDSTFTLSVSGTNFTPNSVVRFNGSDRTTLYVSATELTAEILSSDLTAVGAFNMTVFNPAPGGGTSNTQVLTVQNPVPAVSNISPESKVAGSAEFSLTVNGANFVSGSVVRFAGSDRTTVFVNSSQLTATILANDVVADGVFPITVQNPAPGGGTSNAVSFTVSPLPPPPDTTPPVAIIDLALSDETVDSIKLTWTAPGDDGNVGVAANYDIRYSTLPITDGNWTSATQFVGELAPSVAGTSQTRDVFGLSGGTTYYFAMKASDDLSNESGLSNVPSLMTLHDAPAEVTDLAVSAVSVTTATLTWTAPGDDDNVGTAASYDVRYSTSPITANNFALVTSATGEPAPLIAGSPQTMTVDGLFADTTYYFALKTSDSFPNTSGISNVPTGMTSSATPEPTVPISGGGSIPPQCADGSDNDGDGFADFPKDTDCESSLDNDETFRAAPTKVVVPPPPQPVELIIVPAVIPPSAKSDLNGDGVVNISDWSIFLFRWGSERAELRALCDMNGDGKVDIFDFSIFIRTITL